MTRRLMGTGEVAELLGCSRTTALKIMNRINDELEAKGCFVFRRPAKVPRKDLYAKFSLGKPPEEE